MAEDGVTKRSLRHPLSCLHRGLGRSLLLWFLAVSLVPLVVVSVLNYSTARRSLRASALASLSDITGVKTAYINSYFERLLKDLHSQSKLLGNVQFLVSLKELHRSGGTTSQAFVRSAGWKTLVGEYGVDLAAFRQLYGFHDVLLVDADGNVLFSVKRENDLGTNLFKGIHAGSLLAAACRRSLASDSVSFSDFEPYAPSGGAVFGFLVAPMRNDADAVAGLYVLQVTIAQIDRIMQMSSGVGHTAASYLIGEDLAIRSNPSDSATHTILGDIVDTKQTRFWLREHVGRDKPLHCRMEHPFRYRDWKGRRVIGTHVALDIAGVRLGVISEISEHDAFAPIIQQRNRAIVVCLVALLFVILSGLLASQSIVNPIEALHRGTEIIGDGNLDHRVGTTSNDEIGVLSRAFDQMVDDLKSTMASRDELNIEVTQRRRVEEELERSNRELEQFGYSASHDLQEPLRKIIAFSDRVSVGCKDTMDDKYRDYLARVQNAAYRMQALIDGLLAYSRVTTKARPFESVDLADTVEGVLQDLEFRISETGGDVRVKELPVLDAEPVQMQQLLQNLIGNALKFQREGVPPVIEVYGEEVPAAGKRECCCKITVRDNGIGFDPKFADRVFQVFQRLHGRGTYEGTGIGLALCKKIVDRHSGTIVVDSKPGEGAVFTVTLPKQQGGVHNPEADPRASEALV
jgi:signal transduction histidine kinase